MAVIGTSAFSSRGCGANFTVVVQNIEHSTHKKNFRNFLGSAGVGARPIGRDCVSGSSEK